MGNYNDPDRADAPVPQQPWLQQPEFPGAGQPLGEGVFVPAQPTKRRKRAALWTTLILLVVVAFTLLFAVPFPYVIETPGPTVNVLGKDPSNPQSRQQVITIDGAHEYKTNGQLRMVTVGLRGGPDSFINGAMLLEAWFDPSKNILPEDDVFPKGITQQQFNEVSKIQMSSSQDTATVAALHYLGEPVPATFEIISTIAKTPLAGKVKRGDMIVSLTLPDGKVVKINEAWELNGTLAQLPVGSKVKLTVRRGNEELTFPTETIAAEGRQGSLLGIGINPHIDFPVKVHISLADIGGPSAGTIFAMGIVDKLTPESLTGGKDIAGTGEISFDGQVLPIGGVVQKMYGARAAGAKYFLLPQANCADALGKIPAGIRAIPVTNLANAISYSKDIAAGDTTNLPVCK